MTRAWPADDTRQPAGLAAPDRGAAQDRLYAGMRGLAAAVESSTLSLPETLDGLLRCAVEASGAAAGAIYLLNADRSLRLATGHGPERSPRHIRHTGAGSGAAQAAYAAIAAGAPILRRDPRPEKPDGASPPGAAPAQVWLPLVSPDGVLGVLSCSCPEASPPRRIELAFLMLVATQAGAAVATTRAREAAVREAELSERRRLARQLHDSLSQSLHSIGLGARTARELLDRDVEPARAPIDHVLRLAETSLVELRALVFDPTPDWLAEKGLVAALDEQIAATTLRVPVATDVALGPEPPVPVKVKEVLYRIAREALQNVVRHAGARHLTVRLVANPDGLALEIADDGVGFDPTQPFPGHLGLTSMRERIADVAGVLDLTSTPGRGTRVRARVPVRPA
jgi:signal transduction histidine kinase